MKVIFYQNLVRKKHQQLKTHDLKSEVKVKDGGQIDSHLIYCKAAENNDL